MSPNLLPFFLWPVVAFGFLFVCWKPYRQRRWTLVVLLLALFSLVRGYFSYRMLCGQPLTCDVGSAADNLIGVTAHFAIQSAISYGAAVWFVAFSQGSAENEAFSWRAGVLGALVATGASLLAGTLLAIVWHWPL